MAKKNNNKPSSAAIDMFDFQGMMDDYYGSEPSDDAGIAQKRTFQQNMIQSGFDQQLSMAQAERAQEYDLDARRVTSELELANQKALMKDTYTYGMSKMGAEYQMQSRFATDDQKRQLDLMDAAANADVKRYMGQAQANITDRGGTEMQRDDQAQKAQYKLAMDTLVQAGMNEQDLERLQQSGALDQIAAQGTEARNLQSLVGDQAFAQLSESGRQAMQQIDGQAGANIQEKLQADRTIQADVLASQERQLKQQQAGDLGTGDYVDLGRIGAGGVEQRAAIAAQNEANIKEIEAQTFANERITKAAADADIRRNTETVQADVDRASGTQQGVVGGTQMERDRQTGDIAKEQILTQGDVDVNKIGATGDEQRKTMQEQTRQTAKDRTNQRSFSRELAAR